MNEVFERVLGGIAARIVETSSGRPWLVVALCALMTVGSAYLAATRLTVDTDSDRLLYEDPGVGQTNRALAVAFPRLQNNLVVMIEADDPADARAASEELGALLARQPERYLADDSACATRRKNPVVRGRA